MTSNEDYLEEESYSYHWRVLESKANIYTWCQTCDSSTRHCSTSAKHVWSGLTRDLAMPRLNTGNPTSSSDRRYITDGEAKPKTKETKETELSANPEVNENPRTVNLMLRCQLLRKLFMALRIFTLKIRYVIILMILFTTK